MGVAYHSAAEEAERAVEEAEELAPGRGHWMFGGDLGEPEVVDALFAQVDEEFGGLDGFVGNAGIWNDQPRPVEELPVHEWRTLLDANLTSIYLTTRAAISRMGPDGRIVLVSSTAAQRGRGRA